MSSFKGKGSLYYSDDDEQDAGENPKRYHERSKHSDDWVRHDEEEGDYYGYDPDDKKSAKKLRSEVPGRLSPSKEGSVIPDDGSHFEYQLADRGTARVRLHTKNIHRDVASGRTQPLPIPSAAQQPTYRTASSYTDNTGGARALPRRGSGWRDHATERMPQSTAPSVAPQASYHAVPSYTGNTVGVQADPIYNALIRIELDDFETLAKLVAQSSDILSFDTDKMQRDAMQAILQGDDGYANRCMQRILILKAVSKYEARDAIVYILNLRARGPAYKTLGENYNRLTNAMYQNAEQRKSKMADRSPQGTYSNPSVLVPVSIRGSVAGSVVLDEKMGGMNLGGPNVSRSPGGGRRESVSQVQGEASSLRAALPRRPSQPPRQQGSMPEPALSESASQAPSISQRLPTIAPGGEPEIRGDRTVSLNANYIVRRDPEKFFVFGRVFKVLWHQPAGADIGGRVNQARQDYVIGQFGEPIHSSLRWMVVVAQKTGYSICCPISTYGKYGLSRKSLPPTEVRAHSICYAVGSRPVAYDDEPLMPKDPIPIVMRQGEKLHPGSRLHFGKHHTVEWNVKVMDIGYVAEEAWGKVASYFARELGSDRS